jgi:hypothetical protein
MRSIGAVIWLGTVGLAAPGESFAGAYVHLNAGPSYATYFPIDDDGVDAEHLATDGRQISFAVGHGFELGGLRLDAGVRAQHLRLEIHGAYSLDEREDDYHANYDYLALLAECSAASQWASRLNGYAGFALGTARHFADRKGEPLSNHQLPVYGTFEGGLLVRLDDWVEANAGVSWVPPVAKVSVISPQLGARMQF